MKDCSLQIASADLAYEQRTVAHDLSLCLHNGQITAILGGNGSGKSTVLRALARILQPKNGAVLLDGADLNRLPTKEVARRLAILPQAPHAPEGLTVWDLVSFGRFPYRTWFGGADPRDDDHVHQALAAVHLLDLAERPVATLSGGQVQRAWIAMALAQETEFLLLDEPTTYLDLAHQLEVMDLIHELKTKLGKTIVLVLHDLNLAARYSDHIVMMKQGRIIAVGTPSTVLTRPILRNVFGIEVRLIQDEEGGIIVCLPLRSLHEEVSA